EYLVEPVDHEDGLTLQFLAFRMVGLHLLPIVFDAISACGVVSRRDEEDDCMDHFASRSSTVEDVLKPFDAQASIISPTLQVQHSDAGAWNSVEPLSTHMWMIKPHSCWDE